LDVSNYNADYHKISRLQAQNTLLAQLLKSEKSKTARLRTDLLHNLTTMIVDFTDAQDVSLTTAVQGVQAANEVGVSEMGGFARDVESNFAENSKRAGGCARELNLGEDSAGQQRIAGRTVSWYPFRFGLR
jgi:kinesin family protein 11